MTEIIYEALGEYNKISGLPYENRYQNVKLILTGSVPTIKDLEQLLASSTDETLVTPWSLDVVRGFMDYVPTTFNMITKDIPESQISEYFGLQRDWKPEAERVLLQLQSELDAKSATIDAAIIHNRKDYGGVINKIHLVNRLYNIVRLHQHIQDRDAMYPFLFGGDFENPTKWDNTLIAIKKMFIEFVEEIPHGERMYETRVRRQEVSNKDLRERFVYVDWLKRKLVDDLKGILLYGSAARTDDPKAYSDFDNWVCVRNVEKAQHILAGTCPAILEQRVIEGNNLHGEDIKHLGIHLFPENDNYILRFIRFLHDSREFLQHTKVLYGEMPFIKVKQDEVIERGISQAYIKLKTISGALNWAYTYPEKMMGKPALFEFIVKNVRFFLQHALNAVEGPQLRTKADLNDRLAVRGLYIPEYKPDYDYMRESILFAMYSVLTLQSEFLHTKRKPNLKFLSERKDYKWDDPTIDIFERMGDLS